MKFFLQERIMVITVWLRLTSEVVHAEILVSTPHKNKTNRMLRWQFR